MQNPVQTTILCAAIAATLGIVGCTTNQSTSNQVGNKQLFGTMPDGTPIDIYTIHNTSGMEARIITYGGIVTSLKVPDRNGNLGDVVLGFDNLPNYLTNSPYFGALIGRYGNRIAGAKFSLDGQTYTLAANNGPNNLHAGPKGFDKVVWQARAYDTPAGQALELTYVSKNGEEGFPGTLMVKAVYTVTTDNALRVDFTATTDKHTVVNLTHHSYFNLAGHGDVLNHEVYINADKFTPVDDTSIPTGELRSVAGTPFDFRKPTTIGARINDNDQQLTYGKGYDHNWVVNKKPGQMGLVARVYEPTSGRVLEVSSTEPGTQFYTGNFLDGSAVGKGGWAYQMHDGFCFEPQHFPDSPNHPKFPSTELKPGETYKNSIVYKFSTR